MAKKYQPAGIYIPRKFVNLVGDDFIAAALLSQIFYWYRPSEKTGKSKLRVYKEDKWWIAKSAREWFEETGMSPKQAFRAVGVLRDLDIIETQTWRFDGAPTIHLRLVKHKGKETFDDPDQLVLLYGGCLKKSPLADSEGPLADSEGPFSEKENVVTGEHDTKTTTGAHSSAAPSGSGTAPQGEGEDTEDPEAEEKDPAVQLSALHITAPAAVQSVSLEADMKGGGKNLQEVLKGLQLDKTSPPEWPADGMVAPLKMAAYWRKLVVFYGHASFMHEATATEKGQWAHMVKREGARLPEVVARVVREWDAFSMHVKDAAGLASRPQHPSVDFLTKHLTSAVNWFLMQQSTPASVDSGASKPFVFVAKPTKKPTTISAGPTDWGAVEAEVLKGKDTNHGTGD